MKAGAKKPAQARPRSKFNPHSGSTKENAEWIEAGDMATAKELALRVADHLYFVSRARPVLHALQRFLSQPNDASLSALRKFACDGDLSKLGDAANAALFLTGLGDDEAALVSNRLHREGATSAGKRKASGADLFAKVLVPGKPLTRSMRERKWLASFVDFNPGLTPKQLTEGLNSVIARNNDAKKRRDWDNWRPFFPERAITVDQLKRAHTAFRQQIDEANGVRRHKVK